MNANLTKLLLACFFITLISGNVSSIYIRPGDIVTENYVVGEALPKYPANYDADKKEQPIHSINSVFPSLNDLRIISDGNIEIISNKLNSTIFLRLKPDLNFTTVNIVDINAIDGNFVNLGVSNNLFGGALYSRGNISIGLGAKYLDADGGSYYVDPSNISVLSLLSVVGAIYSGGDIYTTGTADDFWLGKTVQSHALFRAYATGNLNAVDINAQDLTLDETLTVTGDSNFVDIGITRNIYLDGNFSRLTTVGDVNLLGYGLGGDRAKVSWNASKGSLSVGLGSVASSFETFAHGLTAKATGTYSTAMGNNAIASGEASVATGQDTTASGVFSTAMGAATYAIGANSVALGGGARAFGVSSTALGSETEARGNFSIVGGQWTYADGVGSIAMGTGDDFFKIFAIGEGSVAMGYADVNTAARGKGSVALGYNVITIGEASVALGKDLTNYNANSVLVQDLNVLGDANFAHLAISGLQFADGGITATGDSNFINIGVSGRIFGTSPLKVGGSLNVDKNVTATKFSSTDSNSVHGIGATAFGSGTTAFGNYSFAGGADSIARGISSLAFGDHADAQRNYSVALGYYVTASGVSAIALGEDTVASGANSLATGDGSISSGDDSAAIGSDCTAGGTGSVCLGTTSSAIGSGSIAMGKSVLASNTGSIAMGSAYTTGRIRATHVGAIAMGYTEENTGWIMATREGARATGAVDAGGIHADGYGSIAMGLADDGNIHTGRWGRGAIAGGYADDGLIDSLGNGSIALGSGHDRLLSAEGEGAISLGKWTRAFGLGAVALGYDTNATGQAAIAIGENCYAATANAICLGKDLTAYNANQVVIQDLNVLGDVSVDGNSFLNTVYGEMYVHTGDEPDTVSIPDVNVFHHVPGLSAGLLNGVAFQDNNLLILVSGVYAIDTTLSFAGGGNSIYDITVGVNHLEQNKCYSQRKIGTGGDVGNTGSNCHLSLTAGDKLTILIEDEQTPPADAEVHNANLTIQRIGN